MPTDESNLASTQPSDLAPAFMEIADAVAESQPLATSCSQSDKRRGHCLDFSMDDSPLLLKQFPENSTRRLDVVINLSGAIGLSFGTIANAIFHDRISPHSLSSTRAETSRGTYSAVINSSWIPSFITLPSPAPEHSAPILHPATGVLVVSSFLYLLVLAAFVAWKGCVTLVYCPIRIFPSFCTTSHVCGIG